MVSDDDIKREYENVLNQLSDPELISNLEKFEEFSRLKNKYENIIAKEEELKNTIQQLEENKLIMAASEDTELSSLAQEEIKTLKEKEISIKKEIEYLLKEGSKEVEQINSIIAEIRAGVGGEEAALFAADLFRMYSKYAQTRGWRAKVLDSNPTEIGGYKEIIFEIGGENVWKAMRHEGGVHRVQRIPKTEKSGRIHTSTCSIAILPKPKKTQIKIRSEELKVDTYRASGPGGQYVNKRETAVRITHLPTGIVVSSQTERSLLQNKENALAILEAKLLEKSQMEEEEKTHGKRKAQIKWAKRAEKIRTYNFPQDRITDHRLKKSWHGLEKIMEGNLDQLLRVLEAAKELNSAQD